MAADFPRLLTEIDALVTGLADRIAGVSAGQLLQRAWWQLAMASLVLKGGKKAGGDYEQGMSLRLVDYVQSMVASVKPKEPQADLDEATWTVISADVKALFDKINTEYQISATAARARTATPSDPDLEEIRFRLETHWVNVRGVRYHVHESQALLDLIEPHSDILVEIFGIDSPKLVQQLERLLSQFTHGVGVLLREQRDLQRDTLAVAADLAESRGESVNDATVSEAMKRPELLARAKQVMGGLFGLGLFDVAAVAELPPALVDELTWSAGEEEEFLAAGEYRGWPLRVWPTMKRPFIRIQGRAMCFDVFSLFDNAYRVLQRIVFRKAPAYRSVWNDRQKAVSESLPFKYFSQLLPGARTYRPVYYRGQTVGSTTDWCEVDGLLIYEDHLFVIEVKGGAFTYTSPATDLPAHIDSLKTLIQKPASQGIRFLDYLKSAPEVTLFDAEHKSVGSLRRDDFRIATVCAVTIDVLTALAARAQHLRAVGVDLGAGSVWPLSIDDLRVLADVIRNPLVFLHFVEQRMNAASSKNVDVYDEMEHLGAYFKENNYRQYSDGLAGKEGDRVSLTGYSESIDDYYRGILAGEAPTPPRQRMPRRLEEIIEFLGSSQKVGRARIAAFLLDASGDYRQLIGETIEKQLEKNDQLGRTLPMSSHGSHAFTLFTWSPTVPRDREGVVKHTTAVMSIAGEESRLVLELEFSSTRELRDVHWREINISGLSQAERVRLGREGERLRRTRVAKAASQRKIGPNEQCPCGSGRKYKRCCRA